MLRHRLSDLNPETKTAVCSICGPVGIRIKHRRIREDGSIYENWTCNVRSNRKSYETKREREKARKSRIKLKHCERCSFVAELPCQLDIHHRDLNHSNNHPDNLQTLCANCHRLIHSPLFLHPTLTMKPIVFYDSPKGYQDRARVAPAFAQKAC